MSGTVAGERRAGSRVGLCLVKGCDRLALDAWYCEKCRIEIEALRRMAREEEVAPRAMALRLLRVCRAARRRLWVVNLLLVGLALLILSAQIWGAFVEWR